MNCAFQRLGFSLLLASSFASQAVSFNTSLVGYWNFDESSGSIAHDSSIYGNNGSLVNGGTWTSGRIGGAISLNGINQYLNVATFPKPTTSFSISTWVYANSARLWAPIAANWGGTYGDFSLGMFSSKGFLSMYVADRLVPLGVEVIPATEYGLGTGSTTGAPLPLGSWHHVAAVANASTSTIQFWRDGQAMAAVGYSGTFIVPPVDNLTIGGRPSSGFYWDGQLDDLALWNRALNSAEIATIFQSGLIGVSPIPEPGVAAICLIGTLLVHNRRSSISSAN